MRHWLLRTLLTLCDTRTDNRYMSHKIKEETLAHIFEELANGELLTTILKNGKDMPSAGGFYTRVLSDKELTKRYYAAKEIQVEVHVDHLTVIALEELSPGDHAQEMQRRALGVNTLKWRASKLKPKSYGDKLDLNHGGQDDNPITKIEHVIIDHVSDVPDFF